MGFGGLYGCHTFFKDRADSIEKRARATEGTLVSNDRHLTDRVVGVGPGLYFKVAATNGVFLTADGEPIVSLKVVNGKLLVSAKIVGSDESLVAEIIDNDWKVNPNKSFDKNYNDNTLEVLDNSGNIVLQVALLEGLAHIAGQFKCAQGKIARIGYSMNVKGVGDDGWVDYKSYFDWRSTTNQNFPKLPRLFKYPTPKHFGEKDDSGLTVLEALYRNVPRSNIHLVTTLEICGVFTNNRAGSR